MKIKVNDSKKAVKIRQTSTAKKLSQEDFSKGVGAQFSQELKVDHLEPITFAGILHSAVKGIKSTGGRPGRLEETLRKKVPLTVNEWKDLEVVSHTFQQLGVSISTGQVASLLIGDGLHKLLPTIVAVNEEMTKLQAAAKADSKPLELRPIADILMKNIFLKKIKQAVPNFSWDMGESIEKK
ncbi:hypothetical protein [Leptospira vanthielii]|uniref:Uncharacterized protein n=1 Tax=Leptospira vanthielii serovar Holland str. Waz Holland = ATCC 700522 TaxID=1218591 RepID=N1WDR9_9LEPT|nr:hypothetical protein [Leptospira vanthielii]EMY71520.1 hypothetical protein LEP1GSC199_1546 [Leptospira vanthielii serovar Holland str. Waz Holland = ATCC 700522]